MAQDITQTRSRSDLGPRVPVFTLNGPAPGPRLVVTGPDTLIRALADLLWEERALAAIKGKVLLRPTDQDTTLDAADALLALDGCADTAPKALIEVVDQMSALGMMPMDLQSAA